MNAIKKVLILGSSALKIGEAGEFDYSGSQAIKALKEENISTVLVNPNVATIQTSEHLADEVYFLPVSPLFIEKIIAKEKPDGILLGVGGQTALNCGIELYRMGILAKHGVKVLGTSVEAILATEDRDVFISKLNEIDVVSPRSKAAINVDEAVSAANELGYPCMIRVAYALGGLNSGICRSDDELIKLTSKGFAQSEQILVEEYLEGWKEIEYEVIRDSQGTCLTICNMENLDPMGIHTGESIVVAPSQTLTNEEYHFLREISIRIANHIGIIGECNVQFAFSPSLEQYRVIEINARLSRSSALASKATGYPLAFVATKLALGYALHEIENSVTKSTRACFEPALDYVVVKIPRWDLKKFRKVSQVIGSAMKSVGEVMAIGRNFEEALQKAVRMSDATSCGLTQCAKNRFPDLEEALANPKEGRILAIAQALYSGFSIEKIYSLTLIDRWFLDKIANVVAITKLLESCTTENLSKSLLVTAKQNGFSDIQIARSINTKEETVREIREQMQVFPCVKQIDTLAAEFPAATNYLYLTYNGTEDDVSFGNEGCVAILGSGAYRIGSSVEFDWCCVTTAMTLREMGYYTIMINHNPETVSTDYDECDRLYFEELSFETIREIYRRESPMGIIISMGGQIPNNLAMPFKKAGIRVLGTSPHDIDRAEDRNKFSSLLEKIGVAQPEWRELSSPEQAYEFASKVGYPVIVRPSYVLSGAAMGVASTDEELFALLENAVEVSSEHPVVVSKYIVNAKEIDVDAVARDGELLLWAVSEHVENAGVHSGDATLVLPPQRTYIETIRRIRKVVDIVSSQLCINGPFNIQFLAKEGVVMVIECNLRASRSFPFVSKVLKSNFVSAATRVIMGKPVKKKSDLMLNLDYVGVKAPQFSFTRLAGADPVLGVEMASTGEVACLGWDFDEAFLKSLLSVGFKFPLKRVLLSTGPAESKAYFLKGLRILEAKGVEFYATHGTAKFMREFGMSPIEVHWPLDAKKPSAVDVIKSEGLDLVINIPKHYQQEELENDYIIRRTAVDFGVPLITNRQIALRLAEALSRYETDDLIISSWGEYC